MDGVLVIDKPKGLTSHDVVAVARRALGERRIGHTGTLDPLATGVLPLVCGRATRLARFLSASDKDYEAWIRFGVATDTYDVTGVEVSRSGITPTREEVERALGALRGEYLQVPPPYSAKKIAGERAYVRARRAEPVSLAPVPVRAARADVIAFQDGVVHVRLTCSAGFYVRSFAHALGQQVGAGACLEDLRRTRTGEFTLEDAITLERVRGGDLSSAEWIAVDALLASLPSCRLTEEGCRRVAHGQDVSATHWARRDDASGASRPLEAGAGGTWVRLLDEHSRLLAVAEAKGDVLHPAVVLI